MIECLLVAACVAVTPAPRAATGAPVPPSPSAVYDGRRNQLHIRPPRLDGAITVDGVLDEPQWKDAALLTGFSQFSPQDGVAAADSTQVLVWYSATAMHFGIRAFEAHGPAHATLADRDKISADDNVQILVGPFHDQRQALVFAVNPLGIQADGTIVENGQSLSGGWNGAVASRVSPDLSQDFVFSSRGRVTDFGYEVEVRIPFKSIKYQAVDPQTWDLNIVRVVQHSGYEDSWAPALRAKPSFLAQGGTLEGLTSLQRGLVLDVTPVVTERVIGAPGAPGTGGWAYQQQRPQLGGAVRWGISNNLTLNAAVRPDFAEVESDAGQIVVDPRQALFFPERRPFFLDGIEQFSVPNNLIYTRRIVQPLATAKLAGKDNGTALAFLTALDDPAASSTGRDVTAYNILRVLHDIGDQSRVGVAYTDRVSGAQYNRMLDVDSRWSLGGPWSALAQLAASRTRQAGATTDGALWSTAIARSGKEFGMRYAFGGISPTFRAQSGFISRYGIAHMGLDQHWTWFRPRGALVESFTLDLLLDDTWQYDNLMRGGDAQDKKYHASTATTFKGGWNLGASIYWETFGFDNALYRNYRIARTNGTTVDTLPFVGSARIPNRDYVVTLGTPQFKTFSGSLIYLFGQDENFYEWAQADIHYLSASASLRPTDKLRIDGTFDFQDYRHRTDARVVGRNAIPRLKLEYQIGRSLFVRAVGQYTMAEHQDLRDESRTFLPLLINGRAALAEKTASLTGDLLLSYRPEPGTVVFVGYGNRSDAEPDPRQRFTFQPLARQQDYVFIKVSTTFRK